MEVGTCHCTWGPKSQVIWQRFMGWDLGTCVALEGLGGPIESWVEHKARPNVQHKFHKCFCIQCDFKTIDHIFIGFLRLESWDFASMLLGGVHSLLYFAYTCVRDLFIGGVIYLAKKSIRWWYFTCEHVTLFHNPYQPNVPTLEFVLVLVVGCNWHVCSPFPF